MSRWEEEKAERNRRSLGRLTMALPCIFPSAVLSRALARPFVPPTPRLVIDSYWSAHHFALIAWRGRSLAGAEHRVAGHGASATTVRMDYRPHSEHHSRLIGNVRTRRVRVSAACAGIGMSICGKQGPTRMRSGTAHVWSHDNSGMRRVITPDFCGACKHGAAMKAADGCGRAPKLIIASRCFGSGANFGMRLGPSCLAVGITKPSGDQSRRSRRKNAQPKRKIAAPRAILLQKTPDRVSARNAAARLTSTNAADPRRCAQQ
jgi:hypothetical protein